MTRFIIGDLLSGRRILDLPVTAGTWEDRLDTAETITATVDLNDPDVQSLDLFSSATPCKSFLAVVEQETVVAAGPIWTRSYDAPTRTLELGAKGMASYFDHRLIIPLLAASIGTDQWTVPDPTDATKTIPNPLLSSAYTGLWLGTIAKKLVQQAQLWTGGNVPIVFQADESSADAAHQRTYLGADFKPVGEAITDLMNVEGGPETNFAGRFTSDLLGLEWLMQVGTVAQPLLFSQTKVLWDVSVPESPVSGLKIDEDGSRMGSWAWLTGGNQSDDVLVARAYDSTLVDAKFPVMDLVDTSHQSVSDPATLNGYAAAATIAGRGTTSTWSFTVEAYPQDDDGNAAGPQADAYATGDFAELVLAAYDPETGRGEPYIPLGGTFPQRIIGRSGDEKGLQIKIACAPVIGGD